MMKNRLLQLILTLWYSLCISAYINGRTYHRKKSWGFVLCFNKDRTIQYDACDSVAVRHSCHSLQYQLRVELSQDTSPDHTVNQEQTGNTNFGHTKDHRQCTHGWHSACSDTTNSSRYEQQRRGLVGVIQPCCKQTCRGSIEELSPNENGLREECLLYRARKSCSRSSIAGKPLNESGYIPTYLVERYGYILEFSYTIYSVCSPLPPSTSRHQVLLNNAVLHNDSRTWLPL